MMFHARADLAGTLILQDGLVEKLDVQTEQMGSFVYPYWHPSGDYIAFSMNKTRQNFYSIIRKTKNSSFKNEKSKKEVDVTITVSNKDIV